MNFRKAFPGKYLKSADLDGDLTVTIARVGIEKVGDDEEPKLALHFHAVPELEGKADGMVCNKTNAEIIAEMYGEETADWIAKPVTLYVDPNVTFGGKRTPAIRIRMQVPSKNGSGPQKMSAFQNAIQELLMELVNGDMLLFEAALTKYAGTTVLTAIDDDLALEIIPTIKKALKAKA